MTNDKQECADKIVGSSELLERAIFDAQAHYESVKACFKSAGTSVERVALGPHVRTAKAAIDDLYALLNARPPNTKVLGAICDSWYRRVVWLREMGSDSTLARYHLMLCISEVRALQARSNAALTGAPEE